MTLRRLLRLLTCRLSGNHVMVDGYMLHDIHRVTYGWIVTSSGPDVRAYHVNQRDAKRYAECIKTDHPNARVRISRVTVITTKTDVDIDDRSP